jgi:hypothetical protein
MAKKKNLERGYDRATRKLNINIRKRETLIEEIENRKEKKKKEIEDLKRENYA